MSQTSLLSLISLSLCTTPLLSLPPICHCPYLSLCSLNLFLPHIIPLFINLPLSVLPPFFLFYSLLLVPVTSILRLVLLACFLLQVFFDLFLYLSIWCKWIPVCSLIQAHLIPKWLNLRPLACNWRLTESHFNQKVKNVSAIQGKL